MSQHTELIARLRGLIGTLKSGAWSTIAEAADALQFTGVLRTDAQVRVKPVDRGVKLVVLCMELCHVGDAHHSVHAEQIFTEATRALAEAKARTLRKGTTVNLTASLADMRISLPHVESVAITSPSTHSTTHPTTSSPS